MSTVDEIASRPVGKPTGERRRGAVLGVIAGVIGLGCCVYPVALVLLGLSSATAAVDLGNRLYGHWGWAFKGAAVSFAVLALWVQRRRYAACRTRERPNLFRVAAWLVGSGVVAYGALYAVTKLLAKAV